jgi:hypothetical protein
MELSAGQPSFSCVSEECEIMFVAVGSSKDLIPFDIN